MQTASGYGNRRMLDEVVDVELATSVNLVQHQALPLGVKQERHDEHEINELAAKIVESNKAHLAKLQQQQALQQQQLLRQQQLAGAGIGALPGANGNGNILNYFGRKTTPVAPQSAITSNGSVTMADRQPSASPSASAAAADEKKAPSDEESQMGHFGWHTCNKTTYIPYIIRGSEKYCAVRIVETKLLNKYLNYLHQDIYNCTCVRSYYITEAESRLLNEINQKHCDNQFGKELFTHKDLVVRLSDVNKFYTFLDVCYRKLVMGHNGAQTEKCGFIRINKESVVPYTVRDNQKYVPLFYFEGETENLKLKADHLSGWDLSYLKFCCKVQGIRNELFASDQVAVISLTDIKSYFPPGIEFEDYWPTKFVDSQLLLAKNGANGNGGNGGAHWTRQPTQPPQKPSWSATSAQKTHPNTSLPTHAMFAAAQQLQAQQGNQMASVNMTQPQRAKQNVGMASNLAYNQAAATVANGVRGRVNAPVMTSQNTSQLDNRMLPNAWANLTPQEQYQLRMAESTAFGSNSLQSFNYNMLRAMQGNNGSSAGAQGAPPPLVRSVGQQGAAGRNANASSMSNASAAAVAALQQHQQYLQQQQFYQQQAVAAAAAAQQRGGGRNVNGGADLANCLNMLTNQAVVGRGRPGNVEDLSAMNKQAALANAPYKMQKAYIEGVQVTCINMKAYQYTDLLMRVQDLCDKFFPQSTHENCRRVLEVFNVVIYRGNSQQIKLFASQLQQRSDCMELVQVKDVTNYMPQLRYIIKSQSQENSLQQANQAPPSKRTRIS